MRAPSTRTFALTALALAGAVVAGGCDVLVPEPPPEPPPPGWQLSAPFPDVRALNDIIVFEQRDFEAPEGEPNILPPLGFAVGSDGTILRLGDTVWTKEDSGTTEHLESIDGFVRGDGTCVLFAVGQNGIVLQRLALDQPWAVLDAGTTNVLFDVAVRGDTDAFIVGDAGTILRWDGTTNALTLQATQTLQTIIGADGSINEFPIVEPLKGVGDAGIMIAVGLRGAVYRYDPNGEPTGTGGNRWLREDAGTTRALAGINTDNGVLVPTTEGVVMERIGDDDWDDDSFRTPAPVFLQDVLVTGQGRFIVGLSEDIYHFDNNGQFQLTRVAEGAELRGVDGSRAPTDDPDFDPADPEANPEQLEVYIVGGGGRIVRGPVVRPHEGETLLETRVADEDFVD